jgi:hypothetical protein
MSTSTFARRLLPPLPRVALACAAACLCAAAAAQPAGVVQSPAAQAASAPPPAAPSAPTIKRWVDDRGVTHYGDALPPQPVNDVKELPEAEQLSPADQARGQADLTRYRQQMQQPTAAAAPAASGASAAQQQSKGPLTCAQQWAQYNAAYSCMDPYRLARGGIRPEASQKCPTVPQPSCSQ